MFQKQKSDANEANAATIAATIATKPKFACYGCNAPGVTRANCPTCSINKKSSNSTINFNSFSPVNVGRDLPLAIVQLFGVSGQAYFDTGARTSVASANLKRVMDFKGCKYQNVTCDIALADEIVSRKNCMATVCKMVIGGRSINIQFIILPDAERNRTLLGADFLEQANIVLNMGQRYWYFEDNPTQHFDFVETVPFNLIETVKCANQAKSN